MTMDVCRARKSVLSSSLERFGPILQISSSNGLYSID